MDAAAAPPSAKDPPMLWISSSPAQWLARYLMTLPQTTNTNLVRC